MVFALLGAWTGLLLRRATATLPLNRQPRQQPQLLEHDAAIEGLGR